MRRSLLPLVLLTLVGSGCSSRVNHQSTAEVSPGVAHIVSLDGPPKAGPIRIDVASSAGPLTVRIFKEKEAAEVGNQMSGEATPLAEQANSNQISLQFDAPAKEKLRVVITSVQQTTVSIKAGPS